MPDSLCLENRALLQINFYLRGRARRYHFELSFQDIFFNKDFFANNEKRGDICDEKSQISPLKRHGKGSFPVLSPKTPIGIFLFALKSDFQEKSHFASEVPENGGKRRKPEKISGFSVGIFFVNTSWRRHPDSDRRISVLLTVALPLGYVALKQTLPWNGSVLERITGLEPATSTLARWRSTK